MTVIDLYWTDHSVGARKPGQVVEAARNTDIDTLNVIRGWVEQLAAQVLRTGTTITVAGDTATIHQPREAELTLAAGAWVVFAGDRLVVVADDDFREGFSTKPPIHA